MKIINNFLFSGITIVVLLFCMFLTSCNRSLKEDDNMPVIAPNFPFPQGSNSLATYAVQPMLPSDCALAQQKMISLLKDILNNNLIFDSRSPLNRSGFRIVLEHHTSYPMTGHRASEHIHEEHITVSESMGYGMIILAYMAGCEEELTTAGHTWRFGAKNLKDYYDGMLRTVLAFKSPVFAEGRRSGQHSWELFGFNTGTNETKFTVNNDQNVRTKGFRFYENSVLSAKVAPFANTPGGDPNGGSGMTGYNNSGTSSATDGDMDIIYSLIVADRQWGSDGEFNYREIALTMLEGFWRSIIHVEYRTLHLGDWAWKDSFTAGRSLNNGTRPSDFILSHLRAYKVFDTERNWQEVIDATLNVISDIRDGLHSAGNPNNGLLPDFALKTSVSDRWTAAPANFLEGSNDGRYSWNSCRTPWRLGTDYLLYGDTPMTGNLPDPSLFTYSIKPLDDFAKTRVGSTRSTMAGLGANYNLHEAISNSSQGANAGFAVPFLLTAASVQDEQEWVDAFWKYPGISNFNNNWYADYYKLIVMITASGNYWKPETMR
ncbi:MAG: glycosyl hydrolase family 8 [Treponema sp.]|nr:glycosyl hydrolase family 8 [Treponema sp.]